MKRAWLIGKLEIIGDRYILSEVRTASCSADDLTRVIDGKSIYINLLGPVKERSYEKACCYISRLSDKLSDEDKGYLKLKEMLEEYTAR